MPNDHPEVHGVLGIDAQHRHQFLYADGSRSVFRRETLSRLPLFFSDLFSPVIILSYFMLAYECDWLWALGLENDTTPIDLEGFLDSIAYGGFNQVLLNFYANYSAVRCFLPLFHPLLSFPSSCDSLNKWTLAMPTCDYLQWNDNLARPLFVGNPANTPWSTADQLHLNFHYWDHFDDVLLALQVRHLEATVINGQPIYSAN